MSFIELDIKYKKTTKKMTINIDNILYLEPIENNTAIYLKSVIDESDYFAAILLVTIVPYEDLKEKLNLIF